LLIFRSRDSPRIKRSHAGQFARISSAVKTPLQSISISAHPARSSSQALSCFNPTIFRPTTMIREQNARGCAYAFRARPAGPGDVCACAVSEVENITLARPSRLQVDCRENHSVSFGRYASQRQLYNSGAEEKKIFHAVAGLWRFRGILQRRGDLSVTRPRWRWTKSRGEW